MLTLMEPEAEGFPTSEDKFHQSLAAQVLKLLAVVAQAGPSGLDNKRTFISRFYGHLYPADIATYFTEQFDRFLDQRLDLGAVCFFLNKKLSYQEKIFCLLVVHEFIVSGDPDVVEIRLAKGMAKMLEIKTVDARFVESQFGLANPPTPDMGEAAILALNVTGDPDTADVYLPFPGLDVVLYKIQNLYCLTKKCREHDVVVDGYPLFQNISTRISHNYLIRINDYDLRHHDLKAYFENKVSPLKAEIYVIQEDLEPVFSRQPTDKAVLRLDFSGARIRLKLLDPFALVNVEDALVTDHVYVNLDDDIFVNGYRLNVRELFYFLNARRELSLSAARSEYLVTNDINGDLFISDELSESWAARLIIDTRKLRYLFDPGDCPYQVYRNGHALKGVFDIGHDDTVFLNGSYLTLDLQRGLIRKARFSFNKMVAAGLKYVFDDGNVGLDEVSFDVEYGELMAIMGPSGSGKSTLLRVMSGFSRPHEGRLGVDDYDLHRDYVMIKNHLGYVPQDDMLMGNLTVYENLYYYAKLRFPDRSEEELNAKIEVVLNDIGLTGRKHLRVGSVTDKVLSGGERKRLNIGLELLSDAEIYLLDEPTSGLSSKDSEKIVELLGNITLRGKIVVCVIHQPSSRIYKHFNKVVLLDHGGKLAYYGTAYRALEYFKCHMEKQACLPGAKVECPSCKRVEPNILLDSLEESLRDIDGSVIGKRKYSPEYWQEQYRTGAVDSWLTSINLPKSDILPPEPKMGVYERFVQFKTLLSRNYRSKVRDRANLVITFLEAPFLGAGVGFILRYNPGGEYSLYTNDLYSIFLFVAVIVTMFLSMTNSVDEIIADRTLFMRERMLNMTNRTYLAAKMLTLMPFALVQNILFVIFGFLFMEVRELVTLHVVYLTALSYAGLSAGLFISSIPGLSSRAAQNIVPLILVPQIILGGALIEYEKMNKSLTIVENSPIPEICQFMPSRWAYEGLVVMQESYNSYHDRHDMLSDEVRELKFTYADEADPAKKRELKKRRDTAVDELEAFRESHKYRYGNKGVHDAVMLGEKRYEELIMENIGSDPERAEDMVEGAVMDWNMAYPMFVRNKVIPFLGVKANTAVYNILVLLAIAAILNMFTLGLLQFREELVRTTGKMARKVAQRRKKDDKE